MIYYRKISAGRKMSPKFHGLSAAPHFQCKLTDSGQLAQDITNSINFLIIFLLFKNMSVLVTSIIILLDGLQ